MKSLLINHIIFKKKSKIYTIEFVLIRILIIYCNTIQSDFLFNIDR